MLNLEKKFLAISNYFFPRRKQTQNSHFTIKVLKWTPKLKYFVVFGISYYFIFILNFFLKVISPFFLPYLIIFQFITFYLNDTKWT